MTDSNEMRLGETHRDLESLGGDLHDLHEELVAYESALQIASDTFQRGMVQLKLQAQRAALPKVRLAA
jgi:hypothetical protein